tara:strand:- start:144 stop:830 length:687 start_codon:yes stop_codon:yes gene_type:complete
MSLVVNRRQTESERRACIQQRNAAYQQHRSDNKPMWLRQRDNRQREERAYMQQQQRRRVEKGEWVDNGTSSRFKQSDSSFKQSDIRRPNPTILGSKFYFMSLDSDSDEEVPAVESFPKIPENSKYAQKITIKDTAVVGSWVSVVNTDKTEKETTLASPPKSTNSLREFISQDTPLKPSKICIPDATLLMAPKKKTILHPVRWGDDSEDEDDALPELSTPFREWGDGAW